jgi:hypothetical protein
MTPKQVTTINFSEITKIEIACKCGASLIFPVPQVAGQDFPPQSYVCPSCKKALWGDHHDDRYNRVHGVFNGLAMWQALKTAEFTLSFTVPASS